MKVLLTGSSGYIGSALVPLLRARGHEVVTLGRRPGIDSLVCDLVDQPAVRAAVANVGRCDAVVHLAARAHGLQGLSPAELQLANVTSTQTLLDALRAADLTNAVRFVLASSVAVYDLLGQPETDPHSVPYSASKLEAEEAVRAEPFLGVRVLRFAPVYDPTHLVDVAKRVYLPGTGLKIRLMPPPVHSLCSIDRAVTSLLDAVEAPLTDSYRVENVADPLPKDQHELAAWFPGPAIPVPTAVLTTLAAGLSLCGDRGRQASRLIRKFAVSTVYPEP